MLERDDVDVVKHEVIEPAIVNRCQRGDVTAQRQVEAIRAALFRDINRVVADAVGQLEISGQFPEKDLEIPLAIW